MLTNLDPSLIFIEDKFINLDNLDKFTINLNQLFIKLDYLNKDKDVIRFGSRQELDKAVEKITNAKSI